MISYRITCRQKPTLYIIAGPNGAGKTTAAYNLLPDVFNTIEFINADEIACGIPPFNPESVAVQAGRIMLERLKQLISEQKSLAFESSLSGWAYLKFLTLAKVSGYNVTLFFVWLNSYLLSTEKVRKLHHQNESNETLSFGFKIGNQL